VVPGTTLRRLLALAVLVTYGWWVTSLHAFTVAATIAVVGSGVIAIAWGLATWRRCGRAFGSAPPIETRGMIGWLLIAAAVAAWQLAAYLQQPRADHPTMSSLTNALLDAHGVRALAFAVWLLLVTRLAALDS
jgi:hypothetical protein